VGSATGAGEASPIAPARRSFDLPLSYLAALMAAAVVDHLLCSFSSGAVLARMPSYAGAASASSLRIATTSPPARREASQEIAIASFTL
jgi:hypothetical protein